MDLQEVEWEAWIGFIWLRIGTGGGNETSGFRTMRRISWLTENLLASEQDLCSIYLANELDVLIRILQIKKHVDALGKSISEFEFQTLLLWGVPKELYVLRSQCRIQNKHDLQ